MPQPWNADDRRRFWRDVRRARELTASDGPIEAYIRQRGLRILVQTSEPMNNEQVQALVYEAIGDSEVNRNVLQVARLFDGDVPEDLRLFFEVVIQDVNPEDLEESPYDACYAILSLAAFQSAEPDIAYQEFLGLTSLSAGAPSTPRLTDKAWALRKMKVDAAWQLPPPAGGKQNGQGAIIAHLDSGYVVHDDLDQVNFVHALKRDFIDPAGNAEDPLKGVPLLASPGHGTRTGSVMMSQGGVAVSTLLPASVGTTGPGEITGVAREASYVPVRCIKSVIVVFAGDVARGVNHATAKGCHIVSMSLGGFGAKALRSAIAHAVNKNLVVVAAAGNYLPAVVYPARYPECIAMAASNDQNVPWTWSGCGRAVALTAPGEDVWAAEPTRAPHGTDTGTGTSYATAHMAGVAALWISFFGRQALIDLAALHGMTLQGLLREHATRTACRPPGWDQLNYGSGIVDVFRLLSTQPVPIHTTAVDSTQAAPLDLVDLKYVIYSIGASVDVFWHLSADDLAPFAHELSTLELKLKSARSRLSFPKISRALRAQLSRQ